MGLIGFVMELVVLGAACAAVVMNAFLVTSCELLDLNARGVKQGSIGLLEFNNPLDPNVDECVPVTDLLDREIEDRAFRCAQVSAFLAFGFGGVLLVFGFFKQCLCKLPCTKLMMDISATGVQICLALVYVIWMSEACDIYTCVYGDGATYLLSTQVLWLIVGCFARCMREGRSERNREKR